jgi:acyl carrier protein
MEPEKIREAVRALVADSLSLKVEEVAAESRLTDDLGADSLDFIEMIFLIEKKFGIKVREGEFNFLSRLDFSSPKVMKEGFLTPEAIEALKDRLPALNQVPDPAMVTPSKLFSLISVETLCLLVERKLNGATGA